VRARIVIVNWNGRAWLGDCLRAIENQTWGKTVNREDVEIVLVDNASTDDSVAFVRQAFPDVIVVDAGMNAGFARGNNLGAAGATTPYLVFLNNDTRPAPGWLPALVAAAGREPSADLVASRILFMEPRGVVDSAGDGYLRCGAAFKVDHGLASTGSSTTSPAPREVFGACGAAFLIRRGRFEALGGFDEDFFMVHEDVDLSYRARLAGARVIYEPAALVEHAGSASLGQLSEQAVFYGQRNLEWTWLKNTPASLLWRSALAHLAFNALGFVGYARQGRARAWLRGKIAAVLGLPRVLAQRRTLQRQRAVQPGHLWAVMSADWLAIKRREKDFSFRRAVARRF
jgi:GT2 family glycosyltransferase